MLGGNGVVVQIDESLFVHKCKVSRKVIVLGGCNDCGYSNSKSYMIVTITIKIDGDIETKCNIYGMVYAATWRLFSKGMQRDAATLLSLIQAHVHPGTIIPQSNQAPSSTQISGVHKAMLLHYLMCPIMQLWTIASTSKIQQLGYTMWRATGSV